MRRVVRAASCALALVSLLAGCSPTLASVPDAGANDSGVKDARENDAGPLALDLLFVLRSGRDTEAMIGAMSQYLPDLAQRLETLGEPLSLHVGILGSNMGAGEFEPALCRNGGDQGALQNTPWDHCPYPDWGGVLLDPADRFLRWSHTRAGDEANFTGPLGGALLCYSRGLVELGCIPSLLGSLRAALDGCAVEGGCRQPLNEGFLRREAALAVVLVTEVDDCSVPPESALFDPSPEALTSLGPLTMFRCLKFGVLCGGQPIGDEAGPRYDCQPGNASPDPTLQLIPGAEVAALLKGLKSDPRKVYVAAIAGPPTPVYIDTAVNGPSPRPTCTTEVSAWPGIRLEAFVREFGPANGRFLPFCRDEPGLQFAWQIDQIGTDLVNLLTGATGQ